MGARETALTALIACRRQGAWSNGILKQYIARDKLERREAALCSRLCYGVLQNRGYLDFYLEQLLTGKLKALHPVVRDVLHLGLYQLLKLDKIPQSAAVNESVTLVRKYCPGQKNAAGLVNAVLRNAVRKKDALQEPKGYAERYSHPQALIDLLKGYVGSRRLEPMLIANNEIPAVTVQTNTLLTDTDTLRGELEKEGVTAAPHPWLADALLLSNTGDLQQLAAFQKGLMYVQDAAARLSVLCAELLPGMRVLDCCAAPGGKSFSAAMAMQAEGRILSCDIHPHKTELIKKGCARLGISCMDVCLMDASREEPGWLGQMDAVIADVPCSGYGIIRKKPDIRYKDPKTMLELPALQLQILTNQANYVKPGGVLMYSTCTLVREENEGVVEAFLKTHPNYTLEPLPLPEVFPKNTSGMLTLVPGEYDTDGFFICRLRRIL